MRRFDALVAGVVATALSCSPPSIDEAKKDLVHELGAETEGLALDVFGRPTVVACAVSTSQHQAHKEALQTAKNAIKASSTEGFNVFENLGKNKLVGETTVTCIRRKIVETYPVFIMDANERQNYLP